MSQPGMKPKEVSRRRCKQLSTSMQIRGNREQNSNTDVHRPEHKW